MKKKAEQKAERSWECCSSMRNFKKLVHLSLKSLYLSIPLISILFIMQAN